jgi:hypothetical protein
LGVGYIEYPGVACVLFEQARGQFKYSVQMLEYSFFINYANTSKYLYFASEDSKRVERIEI